MSIIHFETMTAVGSGSGGQLQYPLGGWSFSAGNGSFFGESGAVIFYGEGETGPGGQAGEWGWYDFGILEQSGVFLTADGAGIENWLFRTANITDDSGGIPGQVSYNVGAWSNGRTDWRALGSGTGIQQISIDTTPDWSASDSPYGNSDEVIGIIEFSKYPRDTTDVTFDSTDVNTSTDRITITGHPFSTGDQAVYNVASGGTSINGTDGFDTSIVDNELLTVYVIDANTIELATNLASADSTPNTFNLTSAGTGTGHVLKKIEVATASNEGVGSNIISLEANA